MNSFETNRIDQTNAQRRKHTNHFPESIRTKLLELRQNAIKSNLVSEQDLFEADAQHYAQSNADKFTCPSQLRLEPTPIDDSFASTAKDENSDKTHRNGTFFVIALICVIICATNANWIEYVLGIRCFVPNNYLIWEATRPISDCRFCEGIQRPLILPNMTQDEFLPFAYLPQPIIIKNAITHWPARQLLTYDFLKQLYQQYPDSLNNFPDECQFLHFKSSFGSLRDLFQMPDEQMATGKPSWYVGFSNCQANILRELRQLYPRPHFLPKDAEIPNTDYIFLGYDQGAVMHLDFIPRLMWQAQLQGRKTWMLSPTPECDTKCSSFSFYVEPGDAVLIDTRIWYHGTSVTNGQFSLTIQSEYG